MYLIFVRYDLFIFVMCGWFLCHVVWELLNQEIVFKHVCKTIWKDVRCVFEHEFVSVKFVHVMAFLKRGFVCVL